MQLTDHGRLMLAALGTGRTTHAQFVDAIAIRPELDYTDEDCLTGLESLTEIGVLEKVDGDEPTWKLTKAGKDALKATNQPSGSPSTVALDLQPGVAVTEASA